MNDTRSKGMDESCLINQWDMSMITEFTSQVAPDLRGGFQQLSSESCNSYPSLHLRGSASEVRHAERPKKIQKINCWNSCTTKQNLALDPDDSSPTSLLFCNQNPPNWEVIGGPVKRKDKMGLVVSHGSEQNLETVTHQGSKAASLGPSHAQDHIIAERHRREKLSQRFIELSAVVPGLKKKDKASVLGDAVKYVKELQERVKTLEYQTAKRTIESVTLVKKSKLSVDDGGSSSNDDNNSDGLENSIPEIEARLSDKTILVRIHCENHKGVMVKVLSEIEKLHVTVTDASIMSFAGSSINITVMAQIEKEFSMTLKDVVRKLKTTLS
ncbi:transcription factor bHLH25 isoform X2 [Elaeis guineensis]|uniref:Transcription factor bHLH18 isoform X2 n=1 Tax=Elaeis guineensis var. tenera TaxID=51953 RepID=A0A8N4EWW4_ELAGV|nr:transcription factor bHLH18 isoform X2 [Elaeis guineensis]